MDERIKKLWVDALRSGEYKQGTGALCTTSFGIVEHCCLGVLCELAIEDGVSLPKFERNNHVLFDGMDATLPESVVDWADLDCENPEVDGALSLAEYNDDGSSFFRIADLIEENL